MASSANAIRLRGVADLAADLADLAADSADLAADSADHAADSADHAADPADSAADLAADSAASFVRSLPLNQLSAHLFHSASLQTVFAHKIANFDFCVIVILGTGISAISRIRVNPLFNPLSSSCFPSASASHSLGLAMLA
jgi:hypothetical protein